MSSRAVVNRATRLLAERRCGHAGTLDPDASGVLVLAFGRATKIIRWLTDGHKTYAASVRFGVATVTDDAQGAHLRDAPLPSPWTHEHMDRGAQVGVGTIIAQIPPAVSALKHEGVRDYERVRRGQSRQRPPRPVRLDAVRTLAMDADQAHFELDCGPGFYVRAWARDLGQRLESAAHLSALQRTYSSGFSVAECVDLDELEDLDLEARRSKLIPLETALQGVLPRISVDGATTVALVDGKRPLAPGDAHASEATLVLGPDGQAVCVATLTPGPDGVVMRVIRGLREDGAQAWRTPKSAVGDVEVTFNP